MKENSPRLFADILPQPPAEGHKYNRGHTLVVGGRAQQTGAARLSAEAALRIGAGLVTVASPSDALQIYASHLTAVMLQEADNENVLASILADDRFNVAIAGPALGMDANSRNKVLALLKCRQKLVLDADALTLLATETDFAQRLQTRKPPTVLTPHEGEFARLFPDADLSNRPSAAEKAAKLTLSTVVLKGPETIIAAPDGRIVINRHATPWLATAGSGDVLAGLIGGMIAQGADDFERVCAAVWIHGDAAVRFGPGLISEDLPDMIPAVLKGLFNAPSN